VPSRFLRDLLQLLVIDTFQRFDVAAIRLAQTEPPLIAPRPVAALCYASPSRANGTWSTMSISSILVDRAEIPFHEAADCRARQLCSTSQW